MSILSLFSPSIYLHSKSTIHSGHRHPHGSNPNQTLPFPATTNLKNSSFLITTSRYNTAVVYSGDVYGIPPPLPPLPDSTPWPLCLGGVLMSAILSIWKTKNYWGPFLRLKDDAFCIEKVEKLVDAVEEVAEMVETTAERVGQVAEEIAEHLPEGSKPQKAALFIEKTAERIAEDADFAGDIIDKIEAAEEDLSSFIKQNRKSKEEEDDDAKQKNDQTVDE